VKITVIYNMCLQKSKNQSGR